MLYFDSLIDIQRHTSQRIKENHQKETSINRMMRKAGLVEKPSKQVQRRQSLYLKSKRMGL